MEHDNDIFWHALNYRTAATQHAEQMWQELEACVNRLIAEEREECAKVCDMNSADYTREGAEVCAIEIRARVPLERRV